MISKVNQQSFFFFFLVEGGGGDNHFQGANYYCFNSCNFRKSQVHQRVLYTLNFTLNFTCFCFVRKKAKKEGANEV